MHDIVALDAHALSRAIRQRTVSCVEVMQAYLSHIELVNPQVNAIVGMQDPEVSIARARERDDQLSRGEYLGWMHGFPHAVKDLAAAAGLPFTMCSPLFEDRVAAEDEVFVARLRAAGAIVIGKTNAPEFGLGSQTYNPLWGTTGNAYEPDLTAGGSSGGGGSADGARGGRQRLHGLAAQSCRLQQRLRPAAQRGAGARARFRGLTSGRGADGAHH